MRALIWIKGETSAPWGQQAEEQAVWLHRLYPWGLSTADETKAWSILLWLHSWSSLELELGDWTGDLLRQSQPKPPSQRHISAGISADPGIQWKAVAGKSQAQDVHRTKAGPQACSHAPPAASAPLVTWCQGCRAWLQTQSPSKGY